MLVWSDFDVPEGVDEVVNRLLLTLAKLRRGTRKGVVDMDSVVIL